MKVDNQQFQIKRLGKEDTALARKLIRLFHEVFEMENMQVPSDSYLTAWLERTDFIAYAVIRENEVIGGFSVYELPMLQRQESEVFIYDIAIKPAFQRKGLGKELLSTLSDYCRKNKIKTIFVNASEEDPHAIDFYHSSDGIGEKVVQFTYTLES